MQRFPEEYYVVKIVMLAGNNPIPGGDPLEAGEEVMTFAIDKRTANPDRKLHQLAVFHTALPLRGHEIHVYVVTDSGDREIFYDS